MKNLLIGLGIIGGTAALVKAYFIYQEWRYQKLLAETLEKQREESGNK